ncbi:MAG: hypothetical protein IBX50_19400 [Marinospirillum sp.]|uniref:hypothetical protein n=1 Tax=Marinospirillum sp. TaxID=2183934 RepID=UPI0019F116C7|nr:hypothetical protein [Marinospirillum sp.]MBE0508856.1 hypothetical protein [Marinospirillum sp.]
MPNLSFREKRALQKTATEQKAALRGGQLSFKQKREAQKLLRDAMAKLRGGSIAGDQSRQAQVASDSPFTPLLSGELNSLAIPDFIKRLESAYSDEEDLGKAKQAAIQYLEFNREKLEAA